MKQRPVFRLVRMAVRMWVILALAALSACQTVSTTRGGVLGVDRAQKMSALLPEAAFNAQAATLYRQALDEAAATGRLDSNPVQLARVQSIARRLIAQVGAFRPDALGWTWQVNVIDDPEINAWCMPGGKIVVYSGMVDRLGLSDDELAAVIGHEMGHALREHARERASQQIDGNVALNGTFDQAASAFNGTLQKGVYGQPNSLLQETEADHVGVELAARAGFDPRAAVSLWTKMGSLAGASSSELRSTHPSAQSRMADLRSASQQVLPLYLRQK
jgi:Zn-dependent protease with chaperone function